MAKSVITDLLQIFKSSISAVSPKELIRTAVKYDTINESLTVLGDTFSLKHKNVFLIGAGKAVQNMAREIENMMGPKIKEGILSIPAGSKNHEPLNNNIKYFEGALNNLPDKHSEEAAKKVNELITKLDNNAFVIVLLSGGGSALLPLPKHPSTLLEKTSLIKKLANSGADIKELNTVRKRISDLKGGQLAIKAQPAKVISLILSDIIGDPIDLIASGPTMENLDRPIDALNIINKYLSENNLPESIKLILRDTRSQLVFPRNNVKNYIIGSNKLSITAAMNEARKHNYLASSLSREITGNVNIVAKEYVKLTQIFCKLMKGELKENEFKMKLSDIHLPNMDVNCLIDKNDISCKDLCLIFGGEITVEVKGMGIGGRNQQLALEFSKNIEIFSKEMIDFDIFFLSAGTDGIDGPTDAAGAIGYLGLSSGAVRENLNIETFIQNNDAYNFYKQFRNGELHVVTGHTDTNVMDIHIIVIKRKINAIQYN